MTGQEDRDRRLQKVLESWFLLEDSGHHPDLASLCEGDEDLMDQVRSLLALDPLAQVQVEEGSKPSLGELPATELGDFTLLGLLGEGGMGRVYLAQQSSLGRYVALKVLDRKSGLNELDRRRFRREAAITASLEHPNIVPIYGSGEEQGLLWLAMKWLSGPSLGELEQASSPRQVAEFGVAIALALDVAHQAGVMHRDIKPENIILNEGVPHLVDFGLSCAVNDETLTEKGVVPGTLAYIAPEQLDGSSTHFDPRSDIYSLGATLYHLIRGSHPFGSASVERLVHSILHDDPPPLGLEGVDRDLETIVLRCLDKLPQRRFNTSLALAEDLRRYLGGMPIHSRKMTTVYRITRFVRRHLRATIVVVLLLVASSLFFGLWYVARAADRIKRQEAVRSIESAWTRRDLAAVETGALTYRKSFGEDENAETIASMCASLSAYERLMDQLVEGPEEQSPVVVEAVLRSSVEKAAERVDARLVEMARIVLRAYLGHLEGTSIEFSSAEIRRSSPIGWLPAMLEGRATADVMEQVDSVDELIVMLAVAKYVERPEEEIASLIDFATRLDPTSYRAHFARALHLISQGDYVRADEKFQSLPLSGRTAAVHAFHRLWIAAATRDVDLANSILEHDHPIDGRFQLALARYREATGDEAAATRAVELALDRDRDDTSVLISAATWFSSHGKYERAAALLESIRTRPTSPYHREWGRALELALRVDTITSADIDDGAIEAVRDLLVELRPLSESGRSSRIRALALECEGRCLAFLAAQDVSHLERAFEASRKAVETNPNSPSARTLLLGLIPFARRPMSKADGELYLETFDGLSRLHERGTDTIPADDWRGLQFTAVEIARRLEMRERAFTYLMNALRSGLEAGEPDAAWYEALDRLRDD